MPKRPTARQRGYTARWERARKVFLADHSLCVMCRKEGRVTPATVVDHIIPHRGDPTLFWDQDNWQALCKPHHDSTKRSEEIRGYSTEVGADGMPIDPNHPWYQNRVEGG